MIVLDANILLYAYSYMRTMRLPINTRRPGAWVEEVLWQTIMAFARIVTNPRLSGKRFTPSEVIDLVESMGDPA